MEQLQKHTRKLSDLSYKERIIHYMLNEKVKVAIFKEPQKDWILQFVSFPHPCHMDLTDPGYLEARQEEGILKKEPDVAGVSLDASSILGSQTCLLKCKCLLNLFPIPFISHLLLGPDRTDHTSVPPASAAPSGDVLAHSVARGLLPGAETPVRVWVGEKKKEMA